MFLSSHRLKVVVLATLCGAFLGIGIQGSNGTHPEEQKQQRVRRNKYGAVIMDAQGNKINYTKEQMMAQKARWKGESGKSDYSTPLRPADKAFAADMKWCYASFGDNIGKSNIIVTSHESRPEIYLGASSSWHDNDYWYTLQYDEATSEYRQVFVSSYFYDEIKCIQVGDVTGDSALEIVVVDYYGCIQLYDQTTKEWLSEIETDAWSIAALALADLEDDPKKEIILCNSYHTWVYSGNGVLEWEIPDVGGHDIVVGQMDGDVSLEIAVTDGYVIDAATRSIQWTWPYGFGERLKVGDIDFDGMEELAAAEDWDIIWTFDVDRQVPKWYLQLDGDIDAIHLTDIDEDGTLELIAGDGQWGEIVCYDTTNQTLEWSIENPEYGIEEMSTGDVDDDGDMELLWGVDYGYLYVADWKIQELEWRNYKLGGPFIGPEIGDLDDDGREELVFVSWVEDDWYDGYPLYELGCILIFQRNSPIPYKISREIMFGSFESGINDLKLYDVDKDGGDEIILASDVHGSGAIAIYDLDEEGVIYLEWINLTMPEDAAFHSVEVGDIDNDGDTEIVAGAEPQGWKEYTTYIYVYDYITGDEEWHSLHMGEERDKIKDLEIGDVDKDGVVEIIGLVNSGAAYIFDGQNKTLEAVLFGEYTALQLYERGNSLLIVLGDENGDISAYRYFSGAYHKIFQRNYISDAIEGMSLGPEGMNDVFLSHRGILSLVKPGEILWESPCYGEVFGRRTCLIPGVPLYVTAGSYAILAFKYNF